MSETPRCDEEKIAGYLKPYGELVPIRLARRLERELNQREEEYRQLDRYNHTLEHVLSEVYDVLNSLRKAIPEENRDARDELRSILEEVRMYVR
jgi:hypothetical protein